MTRYALFGRATAILIAGTVGFTLLGCGGGKGTSDVTKSSLDLTAEGWASFEAGDYSAALGSFQAAADQDPYNGDAWNGAGWSAGRLLGKLAEARDYFARSYSTDTTRYDALGGWTFVSYQTGNFTTAIDKADSLLVRRPGWRFLHEPAVDFNDIRLLLAKCQYNLGDFALCYDTITRYLSPSFEADIATPLGREELLHEIERLDRIYG